MNRLPLRHNDDQRPVNLPDMYLIEVEGINVAEWHSLPNGKGKARAVDELITALITHRNGVWPKNKANV